MINVNEIDIRSLTNGFANAEEAFIRADSISYLLGEGGYKVSHVRTDLPVLINIAKMYLGQEGNAVLRVIEAGIDKALQDKRTALSRYLMHKEGQNPIYDLSRRVERYKRNEGNLLVLRGMENLVDEVFCGFEHSHLRRSRRDHGVHSIIS